MKTSVHFLLYLIHFFLEWKKVSDKICREKSKGTFHVQQFFGKNLVKPGRWKMTIWRMRIACWIPKAANTRSEYVKVIALPLQQWLHDRAPLLRCMYIVCPVIWLHSLTCRTVQCCCHCCVAPTFQSQMRLMYFYISANCSDDIKRKIWWLFRLILSVASKWFWSSNTFTS